MSERVIFEQGEVEDNRPEVTCVLDFEDESQSGLYGPFPTWRAADAFATFLAGLGPASWTIIPLLSPTDRKPS